MFQIPDGLWNHGEGFRPGSMSDHDSGGWHGLDDGTGVEPQDVHSYHTLDGTSPPDWSSYTWIDPLHPLAPQTLRRFVGYLRPAALGQPGYHPRYPGSSKRWVDQAAFELFAPVGAPLWPSNPSATQKIAIVVGLPHTQGFPRALVTPPGGGAAVPSSVDWRHTYLGYFSPDGLIRDEKGTTAADFDSNLDPKVGRAAWHYGAVWQGLGGNGGSHSGYYPICGYIVNSVQQRQTELVHQRALQLVQAIKHILADEDLTPLPRKLTAQEIEDRVVVVLAGGRNGGLQSGLAGLLHPRIVHGVFAQVINPSLQRLVGEQEAALALSAFSAAHLPGTDYDPIDTRNWAHFPWIRGLELHDLSLARRYLRGETYRPFCHYVGDEDVTSTGTDWIRLLHGAGFVRSGIAGALGTTWPYAEVAWMSADKRCHDSGQVVHPYTGQSTLHESDVALDLIGRAVLARSAQLAAQILVPDPPLLHLPRGPGESLRGIDDPHEWALGRLGQPVPAWNNPDSPLVRDDAFFAAVQPGAAGTWLGCKEAILIRDERVYVGSAEGIISSFKVDWTHPRKPLVRDAQSPPLGHQAFALAALANGSSWELVVGTQRHLHKLNPTTLQPTVSVEIPWERGRPHRLRVLDILPGSPGKEIVHTALHGGLEIYDAGLGFLKELSEPGIIDFVAVGGGYGGGDAVALLSERGLLGKVAFDPSGAPFLLASSTLQTGQAADVEAAALLISGQGQAALVTVHGGDEHGFSLRAFGAGDLAQWAVIPHVQTMLPAGSTMAGIGQKVDLTTVRHTTDEGNGDHLLLLTNDALMLFNQYGSLVGVKHLYRTPPLGGAAFDSLYSPGLQAMAVAVGELGGGSAGQYTEEVVVVGLSGRLMWLHAADLAAPGFKLPASYTMVTGTGSAVQPCTNEAMSATWALTTRSGDNLLHTLDQTGNYWQIDHAGTKVLVTREFAAAGMKRGWEYVGGIAAVQGIPQSEAFLTYLAPPVTGSITTSPWCPLATRAVVYEQQAGSFYLPNNWMRRAVQLRFLEGFLLYDRGGSVLPTAAGLDVYWWSASDLLARDPNLRQGEAWANMVQGMRLQPSPTPPTWDVAGIWVSTGTPPVPPNADGEADRIPYLDLRNVDTLVPYMDLQALRAVQLGGQTYLVLSCPGGRIRILQPGDMRTGPVPHLLGNVVAESEDFGHGACALAVRVNTSDIDIVVGTFSEHAPRGGYPNSPLSDSEVMAGAVRCLRWSPGTGLTTLCTIDLHPTTTDARGGYGVVGLLVGDVVASSPGDELVITTLAGDLFVHSLATGVRIYRTWVAGAIGVYNAMALKDLDNDGKKELYVAGSLGIHRFIDPGEHP